jgi:hypothetical protein
MHRASANDQPLDLSDVSRVSMGDARSSQQHGIYCLSKRVSLSLAGLVVPQVADGPE